MRGERPIRARLFAAVLLGALVGMLWTAAPASALRKVVYRQQVAPGLKFTHYADVVGPEQIFVLRALPSYPLTLDPALASKTLGGFERTSAIAAREGAIAAVNGDFAEWSGRPTHLFAGDASVDFTAAEPWGTNFSISNDETAQYMDKVKPDIQAVAPLRGVSFNNIVQWNDGDPGRRQLAGYSKVGASQGAANSCSIRLFPKAPWAWFAKKLQVLRAYRVGKVLCQQDPMPLYGGVVLSAVRYTPLAGSMKKLRKGDTVKLTWTLGWKDVLDTIGGLPRLVRNGKVSQRCTWGDFCGNQPRTGIGVTPRGAVLMVVVDGRRSGSVGMTLNDFARLFKWLGANNAMNFDGGGSATMVVRGKVKNRPSDDTGERPITSAMLVLPGPDADIGPRAVQPFDDASGSYVRTTPTRFPGVFDPGSTGGMLAAMARGYLGPHRALSATERAAARAYLSRAPR